jgi:hypothetical protein
MAADRPHARRETYLYAEADWMSIIHPGTRIHILHGGAADEHGVYECARHLQGVWGAGVVWAASREHMAAIVRAVEEGSALTRLIVVASTAAIASYPTGYDALVRTAHVTVIVAAALATVAGAPYSHSSHIVAVMLPSCRVDMDHVRSAAAVYCFPEDTVMLEQSLWSLPHGMGLAWTVGQGRPLCVSFLEATAAHMPQQETVDRLFWWAAPARPRDGLPAFMTELVTTKGSPFYPAHGVPPQRVGDNAIRICSSMDAGMLRQARSSPAACATACDFHIVARDGSVHPFTLALGACTDELILGETLLSGEREETLFLTGTCQYPRRAAAVVPAAPPTWKDAHASLPEL